MAGPVTYREEDGVAWIGLDDGKANAINPVLVEALDEALGRAEAAKVRAVVLRGRPGYFSGGLDLKTLPLLSPDELQEALLRVFEVSLRLAAFPRPVVALSTGHALAAGAVLLLAADWKVGCTGAFRYGLHEVTLGVTMPTVVCELARHALDSRWAFRAVGHGEVFSPEEALRAGFLEELCEPAAAEAAAARAAARLGALPNPAYANTKRRLRLPVTAAGEREVLASELSQQMSFAFGR